MDEIFGAETMTGISGMQRFHACPLPYKSKKVDSIEYALSGA